MRAKKVEAVAPVAGVVTSAKGTKKRAPDVKTYPQTLVSITTLNLADYNPREITREDMRKLKKSLIEFGFVVPIAARSEDGLVLGGHQRIAARLELAAEAKVDPKTVLVPVIHIDGLSDAKAKLLNLALNKIGGTWDYDALAKLLSSLSDSTPEDMALSGFGRDEVKELLDLLPGAGAVPPAGGPVVDPDDALAREALRFSFQLTAKEDADVLLAALKRFGMTGLKTNGALALVKIAKLVVDNDLTGGEG